MVLLVLVVDRDDDLGVKTGIKGPIIGREEVLKAATSLLLKDPEDSDGNTMFAALKIYDELESSGEMVQIAVVTGDRELGIKADKNIHEQLREIFSSTPFEGIIFVSDGAEDDQVIPIVTSFAPIVSKKTVVVRQAKELEKTFYTIKTALEDPSFSRLFLGIPGLIFLLWFFLQENALRIILGLLGAYLIIRGFGMEEPLLNTIKSFVRIDPHSPSLPFHLLSLALLIIGVFLTLHSFTYGDSLEATRLLLFSLWISFNTFLVGKAVESWIHKKAYKIGNYIMIGGALTAGYIISDALLNIIKGSFTPFEVFILAVATIIFYFFIYKVSALIKRAPLLSPKVKGVPVFDKVGNVIGIIKDLKNEALVLEKGKKRFTLPLDKVRIIEGHLIA